MNIKVLFITPSVNRQLVVEADDAFIWDDMVLENQAWVANGKRSIMFKTVNGYPIADVGDLVILIGKNINVWRMK